MEASLLIEKIKKFHETECDISNCKKPRFEVTAEEMEYYERVGRSQAINYVLDLFGEDISDNQLKSGFKGVK